MAIGSIKLDIQSRFCCKQKAPQVALSLFLHLLDCLLVSLVDNQRKTLSVNPFRLSLTFNSLVCGHWTLNGSWWSELVEWLEVRTEADRVKSTIGAENSPPPLINFCFGKLDIPSTSLTLTPSPATTTRLLCTWIVAELVSLRLTLVGSIKGSLQSDFTIAPITSLY